MDSKISKNQALLTAIGFMIGSGIFFKADDIVLSVQGNIMISVFSWVFASFTLVFAGVSVAAIASQENIEGGFVGYIEHYFSKIFNKRIGKTLAFIIGWYQIVIYIPIMVAVVSRTFADYFYQLIGLDPSEFMIFMTALILIIFMFIWNGISTKVGAVISASSTVIKIIPLLIIAFIGMVFGDWENLATTTDTALQSSGTSASTFALFLAPLLSISFAYDGWISVGALARDMKNPKQELPFVFVWSVIITAIIYISYYIGINLLMPGSAYDLVQSGNSHVGIIATSIGGTLFSKFTLFAVIISVLGTANAIFMAGSRYVHKLATSNLLMGDEFLSKVTKNNTVFNASIFTFISVVIFNCLYSLQNIFELNSFNIDDIPMAINAFFYLFIFAITIWLYKNKQVGVFQGLVAPIIAIIGQVMVIIAFMFQTNGAFLFIIISTVVILLGFINSLSPKFALNKDLKE